MTFIDKSEPNNKSMACPIKLTGGRVLADWLRLITKGMKIPSFHGFLKIIFTIGVIAEYFVT